MIDMRHDMNGQARPQRYSGRGRFAAGGLGILLLGTVVPFAAEPGNAEPLGSPFTASASAFGSQVKITSPAAPVSDTVLNAGGPTANAVLDGVGGSRAYGSFPFPGELPATAPGLVRGLSGLPVPDYPFYVASYHPAAPRQEFAGGGIVLRAQSAGSASSALASAAGIAQGADGSDGFGVNRSEASTTNDVDGVVAQAESDTAGVQLDQLKLASVVSSVRVTLSPDGARRRSAVICITGIELGGKALTTGQNGITVGDQAVPGTEPTPVIQALAGAGFTLQITPASKTETGMTAPALTVSRKLDSGQTFAVNIGAASAAIDSPGAVDGDDRSAPGRGVGAAPPIASSGGAEPGNPSPAAPEATAIASSAAVVVPASGATSGPLAGSYPADSWFAAAVPAASPSSPASIGGAGVRAAAEVASAPAVEGGATLASPAPRRLSPLWNQLIVRSSSGSPLFGIVLAGGVFAVGLTVWMSRKARSVS